MKKHPDPQKLSALLDGDLASEEMQEVSGHLEGCAECSGLFHDLRVIQEQASGLSERLPSRDLWPEIARSLRQAPKGDPDVIRLHPEAPRRRNVFRRHFRFSLPQAAAAGLTLALFSGLVGAGLGRAASEPSDSPLETASSKGSEASWVSLVSHARPGLETTVLEISQLEDVLTGYRDDLDPATAAVLEKNLAIIDQAITESIAALRADPGNRFLENNLERAVLAKGDYLRDAVLLVTPAT